MDSSTIRNVLILTSAALVLFAALAVAPGADADDPQEQEKEYDRDLGQIWSYSVLFRFTGYDAQSVTWDFGDGSEPVTAWSVVHDYPQTHTYEKPGVYYVTQTAHNSAGDSVEVSKVEVMGYPYVEFVSNGGTEVERIQMTSGGSSAVAAEEPEAPTKDGFEFTGWYTDPGCTQPYDWSQVVKEPVTLYAGWSAIGGDDDGSDDTDMVAVGLLVAGAIIAILSLLAISAVGPVAAVGALVGIIIAAIGAMKFLGVF